MTMTSVSVIMAVMVINIYNRSSKARRAPQWLKVLVLKWICRLLRMSHDMERLASTIRLVRFIVLFENISSIVLRKLWHHGTHLTYFFSDRWRRGEIHLSSPPLGHPHGRMSVPSRGDRAEHRVRTTSRPHPSHRQRRRRAVSAVHWPNTVSARQRWTDGSAPTGLRSCHRLHYTEWFP